MKKRFLLLVTAFVFLAASSASALVINLENWRFNPKGADSNVTFPEFSPIDEITILGNALINGLVMNPNTLSGVFNEYGVFEATSFNNDNAVINPITTGLGVFGFAGYTGYELTFEMFDTAGTFQYNPISQQNDLVFTQSKFNIYLDTNNDYGTTADTFGADNGVLIAAFELVSGTGTMKFNAQNLPDGSTDLLYVARQATGLTNGLLPGVWFTEDGTDMSTLSPELIVMSVIDTNNQIINAVDPLYSELAGKDNLVAGNYIPALGGFNDKFFVRSDGSFGLAVVPEPATMLLFGFGLMGLAAVGRKRQA